MKVLHNKVRRFILIEDGLVALEWIALTAGLVVIAVAVGFVLMSNTGKSASNIGVGIQTKTEAVPKGQ